MFSGLIKYFPLALAVVAEHSRESNDQHNPGEPLHWAREKSTDHCDCIARHLADYGTGDKKAMRAIAWRSLAQLELDEEEAIAAQKVENEKPVLRKATAAEMIDAIEHDGPFFMRRLFGYKCEWCDDHFSTPQGLAAHLEAWHRPGRVPNISRS